MAECTHLLKNFCKCPKAPAPLAPKDDAPQVELAPKPLTRGAKRLVDAAALAETIIAGLEDPDIRAEYERDLEADRLRKNFSAYVRAAWHVVEQSTELQWNWHHELLCRVLQGVFEDWEKSKDDKKFKQRVRNVLFNVPPGSLKSRIIAVMFPTWCWLRRPGVKFICLSVNEEASLRDARDSRTLLRDPWYAKTFKPDWKLNADQDAVSNYGNTAGGTRLSRAQGSVIVGLRCLAGDTLVDTEWGKVAIEELHEFSMLGIPLPRVWSMNHVTGELELRDIEGTSVSRSRTVVDVQTTRGTIIRCTPDHRFYVQGEYVEAQYLAGRDVHGVCYLSGVQTVDPQESARSVYDIRVEGNHNFFANGILVHNCDILLVDDPNDPKEAETKRARDEVNELWETNIYNRVNDVLRSLRIGVQQRTHAHDWTGFVLKNQGAWSPSNPEGWLHVVLPAEFEAARRCVTPWGKDPRKVEGESLDPVRWPVEWLIEERKRFGSAKYAGQMQQRPALVEGGRVKRNWWSWFTLARGVNEWHDAMSLDRPRPAHTSNGTPRGVSGVSRSDTWDFDWIVISVDPAAKKTERGSNYGILVVAGQDQRRFILDDRSQRGDILEILAVLKELVARWKPGRILIEAKAAGPDLITLFEEQLAAGEIVDSNGRSVMVVVEPVEPGTADKEMRLDAVIPYIEQGAVHLMEGAPWVEEFIQELAEFPSGARDDRVDAISQVLNHIRVATETLPDW
jgi:predicted phage terminase large subunit-like protein